MTVFIDGRDVEDMDAPELRALAINLACERDDLAAHVSNGFIHAKPSHDVAPSRSRLPDPTKTPEIAAYRKAGELA